jgi:hypothetical protein
MITAPIATGHWLRADAAESYERIRLAGCPAGITSAGRSYAEQVYLYTSRYSQVNTGVDHGYWDGKDWWRKPDVIGYVAIPGTSTHETGLSLDLPEPARAWVREHGAAYGWIKDTVNNEPWHMTYFPTRDEHTEDPMPLTQEDLEAVREASANGTALLYTEMAAGSTVRGRQARDGLRLVISGALTGLGPVARQTLTKELLDGLAKRLSQ